MIHRAAVTRQWFSGGSSKATPAAHQFPHRLGPAEPIVELIEPIHLGADVASKRPAPRFRLPHVQAVGWGIGKQMAG